MLSCGMDPKQAVDSVEFGQISRRQMCATLGVAGAASLAGCTGVLSGGSDSSGSIDATIRYIPHGAPGQDPFWDAQAKGWDNAVQQLGVDGSYQGPDESSNFTQQVQNIETAIDSGADAIAVTLPDPDQFRDSLERAAEEDIYVIVTNVTEQSYLEEDEQSMPYQGYVGQDEAAVGSTLASNTLPLFEEEAGSSPESAVILNHDPGHSALELRQQGIEEVLNDQNITNDWIEVPSGDPAGVISRLSSHRSSNSGTNLIFSLGPTAGEPAIDYITNEDLEGEVFHAGVDISQSQAEGIREGYNLAQVIQQPGLQAYLAAHYLATQVGWGILTPRHTPTGPTFVNADNVSSVEKQIETFGVA